MHTILLTVNFTCVSSSIFCSHFFQLDGEVSIFNLISNEMSSVMILFVLFLR
ncbi:hypothetical protein M9458_007912, partial [Cirrhinus mrigala]